MTDQISYVEKGSVVSYEACGVVWFARVRFTSGPWLFVTVFKCADPKAFVPRDFTQCLRRDECVKVEEVKA